MGAISELWARGYSGHYNIGNSKIKRDKMKIKKIGHCCLLIQEHNTRILTDPGNFSSGQDEVENIDAVLITHEHGDHLHIESLKTVLKNNPKARVFTNKSVSRLLVDNDIRYEILDDGKKTMIENVSIEGFGKDHALIHKELPCVENTGYLINDRFFYPGDALTIIKKKLDILALPVAGPWVKISESIDYAKKMKPKKCFPVHDGMIIPDRINAFHAHPKRVLATHGIEFIPLLANDYIEL
jgi:L-ascorbate metabolism protein UlaG (beta-lactamase superfamily)